MVELLRRARALLTDSGSGEADESSRSDTDAARDGGPPDDETGETGAYVYECPGCEEVYLSEAPHSCSACGETTTRVASDD